MDALIVALIAFAGCSAVGLLVHYFRVVPLRKDLAALEQKLGAAVELVDLAQTALGECRNAYAGAEAQISQLEEEVAAVESRLANEADTNRRWVDKFDTVNGLVERYHFALTSPVGIGNPENHLAALFAHFGHEYTPKEAAADGPELHPTAPTEGQ